MPQQRSLFGCPFAPSIARQHDNGWHDPRTSRAVTTPEVIYLAPNTQEIPASSLNCVCGAAALLLQNSAWFVYYYETSGLGVEVGLMLKPDHPASPAACNSKSAHS